VVSRVTRRPGQCVDDSRSRWLIGTADVEPDHILAGRGHFGDVPLEPGKGIWRKRLQACRKRWRHQALSPCDAHFSVQVDERSSLSRVSGMDVRAGSKMAARYNRRVRLHACDPRIADVSLARFEPPRQIGVAHSLRAEWAGRDRRHGAPRSSQICSVRPTRSKLSALTLSIVSAVVCQYG